MSEAIRQQLLKLRLNCAMYEGQSGIHLVSYIGEPSGAELVAELESRTVLLDRSSQAKESEPLPNDCIER